MSAISIPLFLLGATGTGKSTAAMELARELGGAKSAAILCLDAMQVYRGADIGTSKPTAAERAEIPHGGLDLVDFATATGSTGFDVAQYLAHAAGFLREQREAGRRAIIVGGTGLYFRALTQGLCEAPPVSEAMRVELGAMTVDQLRARLAVVDAPMLKCVDPSNPRRLARAIAVKEATGRSLREWQAETPAALVPEFTAFWIQREKAELEARIEARGEAMFAAGWVAEVMELQRWNSREAVSKFPGIGYREIAETIGMRADGEYIVPKSLQRDISMATRQYAKRQLTWFAREPNLHPVMLTGNQSFTATLRGLGAPVLL